MLWKARSVQDPVSASTSGGEGGDQFSRTSQDWIREAGEEEEDELGRMLDDPSADPETVNRMIREKQRRTRERIMGEDGSMKVTFRDVDTFNLWMWVELYKEPTMDQKDMLEGVFTSWFMMGRLGGYNGMNLQLYFSSRGEASNFEYDQEQCESAMQAFFHEMEDMEYKRNWARCWVNLGTADELSLDILINALFYFSRENVRIKQLIIGGENPEWPVPKATMAGKQDRPYDPIDY